MGYATIVSGGDDGRYVISMDYGEPDRVAGLAALSAIAEQLLVRLSQAQVALDEALALEAAQAAKYEAAVEAFIAQHASVPAGAPKPNDSVVKAELKILRALQLAHQPQRINVNTLKFERAQALKQIAYYNGIIATNTRSAWCADFTEDGAPGQVVATMEIPGDDNLIVITPGCRGWQPTDGRLASRELMSPAQAFFNAAIFPGWQIDRPTYRWGTVVGIPASNRLDVTLAPATSSAQSLNVNRETALTSVPVDYMETGSSVFQIGDRVVVQFQNQSWDSPRVAGFLDNPRPAGIWDAVYYSFNTSDLDLSQTEKALGLRVKAGASPPFSTIYTACRDGSASASYRVNGEGWETLTSSLAAFSARVVFTFGGESTGLGFDLLTLTSGGGLSTDMRFTVFDAMSITNGSTVEARIFVGSELVFNAAFVAVESGTAEVAIVGRLLNQSQGYEPPVSQLDMARLSGYMLYQSSGE